MMLARPSRNISRSDVESLVRDVLRAKLRGQGTVPPSIDRSSLDRAASPANLLGQPHPLVVNVSARHMHATPADVEALFGSGVVLSKMKDLYQGGEFASEQLVTLVGPRQRIIPNVRILGPTRSYTQVELSYTDGVYLGLDLPLRISGNHEGTPGITILGPKGSVTINKGVIRAERHVHMGQADLDFFHVRDGDYMRLKIDGPCGVTFDRVKVRFHPKVKLEIHIDTDEGNACDIESATRMQLLK